jgi:hypothetical protein
MSVKRGDRRGEKGKKGTTETSASEEKRKREK